jgi:hypothetical protein
MAKTPRLGPLRNSKPSMKIRSFAFALLILGVVACNAFPRGSGNSDRHLPTEGCSISRLCAVLEVNNQGFLDKNVFAVGLSSNSGSAQSPGSQRVRLGTARREHKDELLHTAALGERPHIPSLHRRPHWEHASLGESRDNSGAGGYCGLDDSAALKPAVFATARCWAPRHAWAVAAPWHSFSRTRRLGLLPQTRATGDVE